MRTITELEAELAAVRAEQGEQARARAMAARAEEQRCRQLERTGAGMVAELERQVGQLGEQMATLAQQAGVPSYTVRVFARRLDRGAQLPETAPTGEMINEPQVSITSRDAAAAAAWECLERCQRAAVELTGLREGHPLLVKVDALECATWRAWCRRVKELAGEAG